MNIKNIQNLFDVYNQIQDVIIDIFGYDISNTILNFYSLQLVNNIKLIETNKTELRKKNYVLNNYCTILLTNLSKAEYYSRTEEYDQFNGDTIIRSYRMIGKFKIISDEIIILGEMKTFNKSYKKTYDENDEVDYENYKLMVPTKNVITIKFSKQELSSYSVIK